jgi:hypothetical protein
MPYGSAFYLVKGQWTQDELGDREDRRIHNANIALAMCDAARENTSACWKSEPTQETLDNLDQIAGFEDLISGGAYKLEIGDHECEEAIGLEGNIEEVLTILTHWAPEGFTASQRGEHIGVWAVGSQPEIKGRA